MNPAATGPQPESIDDRVIQASLREVVGQSLRPAAIGLAALYVALTISHLLFLPPATAPIMAGVAAVTALIFGLWAWGLGRRPAARWSHAIGASYMALAAINTLIHMALQRDILQTTNLAFIIIAAGGLLLSLRWMIGVIVVLLVAWGALISQLPASPYVVHFAFALFIAMALGVVFYSTRLRVFSHIARLRHQEELYQHAIEQAVVMTEYNEQRIRSLSEAAFEGIAIHEAGVILDANSTLAEIVGVPLEQLLGSDFIDTLIPADQRAAIRALVQSDIQQPYEAAIVRPDGSSFVAEVRGRSHTYNGRKVRTAAIRDVSQRKQIEEDLRLARDAAQAGNVAKSAFLATVSHEFRTPLNTILGFGQIIKDDLALTQQPRLEADVDHILDAGQHLLGLIDDVIQLSSAEMGQASLEVGEVMLDGLLAPLVEAAGGWAREHGNSFEFRPAERPLQLHTDGQKLIIILQHLLKNAAKFTTDGTITLSVTLVPAPAGSQVMFTVADTGIGIAPDQQAAIFQPFTQADSSSTRRYAGTGLGLTISQHLAALLHGSLSVQSRPGAGSTFTLSVPAVLPAPEESASPALAHRS
jgi:PAS domain S-box-containing protein